VPLPLIAGISSTLSIGLDYKNYSLVSYNTNNFFVVQYYNDIHNIPTNSTAVVSSGQPTQFTALQYLPLNIGINGSVPDSLGTTFFNATVNFNPFGVYGDDRAFAHASYSTNARANYVTVQSGVTRDQTIYKEWSVRLHADGQWADSPLFSNEQFGMGGPSGVRGYKGGASYGDTGWRISIEPRTPQVSIGMAGNEGDAVPVWLRGSVFMDYGQVSALNGFYVRNSSLYAPSFTAATIPGNPSTLNFWGTGWSLTANIGSHLDARLTMAFPLIDPAGASGWNPLHQVQIYFGVGAQF